MALLYFDMFWPNIVLWFIIITFYVLYISSWAIDQCIQCCRRNKKRSRKSSRVVEASSYSNKSCKGSSHLRGGDYCPHQSPSCCALNGCKGLPYFEYTLRLQNDDQENTVADVADPGISTFTGR